jgi:hypothetical protein
MTTPPSERPEHPRGKAIVTLVVVLGVVVLLALISTLAGSR